MNRDSVEMSPGSTSRAALLAAVAGLIVLSLLVDPAIINPFKVDWLAKGDPAQSYLGWLFFRHEPWSWPLGVTHALGMEQASSIVYSDSIPLLAIPLKLFSAILPANFQYHGLWLFGCYALQGFFACRLLMLFTRRPSVVISGVLLFLLSPVMLLRAQSHFALSAHWIVIAAIYLYYAPITRRWWLQWLILLWLTPLIHAYLMFMAFAIWAASLLRLIVVERNHRLAFLLAWAALAFAGSLAVMWVAGYFLQMDVSAGGFGYFSMNMLSPLLPVGVPSFVMHAPAAATNGQYEGFNYLGLGVVFALAMAVVGAIGMRWRATPNTHASAVLRSEWPLLACCLVLSALALSNVVTLGSRTLFTLPLAVPLKDALNVFRASGRLFWPVYYLLILAALRFAASLSAPLCARLLAVVLVLQTVDLWRFIQSIHRSSEAAVLHNRFPTFGSPFWERARAGYDRMYVIPGNYADDSNIGYESLAGAHGFAIDSAYYARMPALQHRLPRERRHALFFAGELDPRGLYLIQPQAAAHFAAMQRLLPAGTGVGQVDGFTVVAPGWFSQPRQHAGLLQPPLPRDFAHITPGQLYHFGKDDAGGNYALAGWTEPGDGAVWSEGATSVLAFRVPAAAGDLRLALQVMPYLPVAAPRLVVNVSLNGQPLAHWIFDRGIAGPATIIEIPAASSRAQGGNVELRFDFDQPRSPLQSGESTDPREIALLLQGMRLQP